MLISAKQIINILEDYFKTGPNNAIVYENPTSSDYIKLAKAAKETGRTLKEFRFIADAKTQKIYLWDSYLETHDNISDLIGFSDGMYLVFAYADFINGKAVFTKTHDFNIYFGNLHRKDSYGNNAREHLESVFSYNWAWADKYVSGINNYVELEKSKFLNWKKNTIGDLS